MKINELSKLTGINGETIRMYRNLGLLEPERQSNGYYEYSITDMRKLLHIRKLRGAGLGLENIKYLGKHDNQSETYEALSEEYDELTRQIEELQRQRTMLKLTMDHFKIYRDNPENVVELDVNDDSYSIFGYKLFSPSGIAWMRRMDAMTQSVCIPPKYFSGERLPEDIPVEMGVGSYKAVLDANNIAIPPEAVLIPNGKYLTMWLTLGTELSIKREQLLPLLRYAEKHGYRFTGESTAFLYRIDSTKQGEPHFIYRFRARVEKK